MSKNKKTDFGGFVFSTNPNFEPEENNEPEMNLPNDKQVLRLWLERGKGGKESTVIKGFMGSADSLAELAKLLKNKCAAGGNAKDGVIIVQGNHRDKILKILLDLGYSNAKKAGG
ncbi:MAG: translation initiation factor [Saprospirales bacterium]|nr:translation initiation factor [Saprospirales bacterium]MBK8923138.1 translation initiation factor [Saprospirales bacterium]